MTDRQTKAVVEAITNSRIEIAMAFVERRDHVRPSFGIDNAVEVAQAAIAASDAKLVPALAEALKVAKRGLEAGRHAAQRDPRREYIVDCWQTVQDALALLPEEYRQ